MNKTFISILILAAAVGLIFALSKSGSKQNFSSTGAGNPAKLSVEKIEDGDHVLGNKSSQVVLIEYSDFQCPACAQYNPIINRLSKDFGDRIAFVYRHYPLPSHKNALGASLASEAAGRQNKFWEYKDLLFENQSNWREEKDPTNIFIGYAGALGLNLGQFQADYNSPDIQFKVDNDKKSGDSIGIDGTPTFFLKGRKIQNPRSAEEFDKIISDALKNI